MLVSEMIDNVQKLLADKGVYRTDTFVLDMINDGYKLVSTLTLFDERRSSISVSGTRNMVALPVSGDAQMIAPLYVANGSTGNRVQPVRLEDMEMHTQEWEGQVDGADVEYYSMTSPYCNAKAELWCVPISTSGSVSLTVVGAYVPADLGTTDTPRMAEEYQDVLVWYGVFAGFVSEPGRTEDAVGAYEMFVQRVNFMVGSLKSRFPSWQGYRPRPVEFKYMDVIRRQQKTDIRPEAENEG